MKNKSLWFGFLNAGTKSSAVINDPMLSTGNDKTMYLYNHVRGSILEYQREIVESKLRELEDGDADVGDMQKTYKKVRADFTPKGARLQKVAEQPASKPSPPPVEDDLELDDDFDDDLDLDD